MTTEKAPLPPQIRTRSSIEYGQAHVWVNSDGGVSSLLDLGMGELAFDDVAQVRELISRLGVLAGEMDAETARHQPAEPKADGCTCTGGSTGHLVDCALIAAPVHYSETASKTTCGLPTWKPPVHLGVLTTDPAKVTCPDCKPRKYWQDAAAGVDPLAIPANRIDEAEQAACPRCGSTTAPKKSGSDECHNRGTCTDRSTASPSPSSPPQ